MRLCVSAASKNNCLSNGLADSLDSLRAQGKKQRDCSLETRTSWGFILTLWHLQFGRCKAVEWSHSRDAWDSHLLPGSSPYHLSIFKVKESEFCFKKNWVRLTKAKIPESMTGSPEKSIRALALSSFKARRGKKCNSHLKIAIVFISNTLGTFPHVPENKHIDYEMSFN